MDEAKLKAALQRRFGGSPAERQAVARAVRDLDASGRFEADTDRELSVDQLIDELSDAPDGGPADRWNWWIGALDVAYGGYERYQVRQWADRQSGE